MFSRTEDILNNYVYILSFTLFKRCYSSCYIGMIKVVIFWYEKMHHYHFPCTKRGQVYSVLLEIGK